MTRTNKEIKELAKIMQHELYIVKSYRRIALKDLSLLIKCKIARDFTPMFDTKFYQSPVTSGTYCAALEILESIFGTGKLGRYPRIQFEFNNGCRKEIQDYREFIACANI